MASVGAPAPQRRAMPKPWRRSPRRAWVRPDDLPGIWALLSTIPSLPRAELARLTERMIDRMDEIDGDPDLETQHEDDEDTHDREREEAYD